MALQINQLPFGDQIKIRLLSDVDQAEVLNCKTVEEAQAKLNTKKESVHLKLGRYEPKLQVSGSLVKYKTKKLFSEIFDEQDVKDFMTLAEMSAMMEDEIISGELKRKMNTMSKDGKDPLQCMVYATKNNEKVFYNNEKKVLVWAQAIAEMVNNNPEYALSINHMLVNWGMWKYQITLLITACGNIKQNEKLDEVIRDLYTDYDDDKVRYTVMKRLLYGLNEANYQSAFVMLKNADFISADTDRKYFNVVKRKVKNATQEERDKLYAAFRGTQGFSGAKRKRVESLFSEKEPKIAKMINESLPAEKDRILKDVHSRIYGTRKDYREVASQAKFIKLYRNEIQNMFIEKLDRTSVSLEDVKTYGLAIGDLDSNGRAIPFLEEQMSMCMDDAKQIMFSHVLAILSDAYIDKFIDNILKYDGSSVHSLLNSVRNLSRSGKNQVVRKYLYDNCIKIRDNYGGDSSQYKTALRNIGEFLQGGHSAAVYDVKFDQVLFEFIGYSKVNGFTDTKKCTARKAALVLGILENVMDKNNYEGRYQKFMWNLSACFKSKNRNITNRIDNTAVHLTGQGIPAMYK